jgi:hypothetical protein
MGDLVRAQPHLPPDLRVLVALELLHVLAHHDVGGRALQAQIAELEAEAFAEVARRHPRGIEPLDEGQGLLDLFHRIGSEVRDLLDGGPQQPVRIQVLDDGVADLERELVRDGHVELPHQVVVEIGLLGERVLDGRQLRDLRAARAAVVAVVQVVLEEFLDVDLLEDVVPLRLGLFLRDLLRRGLLLGDLLQERVLHHLLLEHLRQLEGGEGKELDGLLQGRREDEPLRKAGAEAELLLNGQWTPDSLSLLRSELYRL